MNGTMSNTLTHSIRVETRSFYVPSSSDPKDGQYFFGYQIRITNEGNEAAQLLTRHWIITDSLGEVEHVRGPGVVGKQPRLEPGRSFEYQSACPLDKRYGTMEGTYRFVRDDGAAFDVEIGKFELIPPPMLN